MSTKTDDPRAWFAHTLALPQVAMQPAVAVKLARADADDAVALWEAWREYAPEAHTSACAPTFAAMLRRGVETMACIAYPQIAWVYTGPLPAEHIADSDWELLVGEMPLTASAVRLLAGAPHARIVVAHVQRDGERVPRDARGPFVLAGDGLPSP